MLTLTSAIRNTMTDAIVDSLDAGAGAGTIQIRSGTRPADPSVTATGTLLATVTCADPAFGSSSGGSATISDPAAVTAAATGTATWFRALDSNAAACFDGLVTATGGGGDLTLTTTSIVSGMQVDVTGGTITVPQGTTP
jgi:hypothetical protein